MIRNGMSLKRLEQLWNHEVGILRTLPMPTFSLSMLLSPSRIEKIQQTFSKAYKSMIMHLPKFSPSCMGNQRNNSQAETGKEMC